MKLTKQIGKTVMVCVFALVSMTGMAFASGSSEITSSPLISEGQSWAGVIDGIAIDLQHNKDENIISGTVTNLLHGDISNVQLGISAANGSTIEVLTLGVPGTYEVGDVVIKQNTTLLGGYASVPITMYLNENSILNNGWKVSIESDNAPKYGLFEQGELLAKEAKPLSDSFVINQNGTQTIVSFSYENEGFSGTFTNYTNKVISSVETTIALNNGDAHFASANNVQPGETVSINFESGVSGFSMYAVESIIK